MTKISVRRASSRHRLNFANSASIWDFRRMSLRLATFSLSVLSRSGSNIAENHLSQREFCSLQSLVIHKD